MLHYPMGIGCQDHSNSAFIFAFLLFWVMTFTFSILGMQSLLLISMKLYHKFPSPYKYEKPWILLTSWQFCSPTLDGFVEALSWKGGKEPSRLLNGVGWKTLWFIVNICVWLGTGNQEVNGPCFIIYSLLSSQKILISKEVTHKEVQR